MTSTSLFIDQINGEIKIKSQLTTRKTGKLMLEQLKVSC